MGNKWYGLPHPQAIASSGASGELSEQVIKPCESRSHCRLLCPAICLLLPWLLLLPGLALMKCTDLPGAAGPRCWDWGRLGAAGRAPHGRQSPIMPRVRGRSPQRQTKSKAWAEGRDLSPMACDFLGWRWGRRQGNEGQGWELGSVYMSRGPSTSVLDLCVRSPA